MGKNRIRESKSDLVYDIFRWIIMGGFALICLLPMLNLLGVSLAPARELAINPYLIWPKKITFNSYEMIMTTGTIPHSLFNSLIITLSGVTVGISLTSVLAYGLSKREVPGNSLFNFILLVFIVFQVGIIPMYITMKTYGLVGKFAAVVLEQL
jgi:putative aldouronate transport system permease protein